MSAASAVAGIWDELDEEASDLESPPVPVEAVSDSEFEQYRKQQQQEFSDYKRVFEEEFARYSQSILNKWDVVEVSTNKTWVSYTPDYEVKRSVDFESNTLTLSAVNFKGDTQAAYRKFEQQIQQVLGASVKSAFQEDQLNASVERRISDEKIPAKTALVPASSVFGLSSAESKKAALQEQAKALLRNAKLSQSKSKKGKVTQVKIDLSSYLDKRPAVTRPAPSGRPVAIPAQAKAFADRILAEAERRKIETSLILAIMKTESAFNPMARSGIPAYGLMQIVPKSAGLDATEYVYGKQQLLAPSYLYNPENNIELGAAYLWILENRYLRKIENPLSRYYCVIAAYNTGAGNVAKAFTGKRNINTAAKIINQKTPDQVYKHLIKNLPYEETQNYLKKVVTRAQGYSSG